MTHFSSFESLHLLLKHQTFFKCLKTHKKTACYYLSHAENERAVSDSVFLRSSSYSLFDWAVSRAEFVLWHKVGIVAMNTCVADFM